MGCGVAKFRCLASEWVDSQLYILQAPCEGDSSLSLYSDENIRMRISLLYKSTHTLQQGVTPRYTKIQNMYIVCLFGSSDFPRSLCFKWFWVGINILIIFLTEI